MYAQYWLSRTWRLYAYGLGLLIAILWVVRMQVEVRLANWIGRFYDAAQDVLQKKESDPADSFGALMLEYVLLSSLMLGIQPAVNFMTRIWAVQWREALTTDYLQRWEEARARSGAPNELFIESASQRVQEDTYRFSRAIDSLGQGFLDAFLKMLAFTPVLWQLSAGVPGLPPGALVWACVGCNVGGFLLSLLVGIRLVDLEYNNQVVEAAFRKELVYAEDGSAAHGAREVTRRLFAAVKENYFTLFRHLMYFELWTEFFNKAMDVVPVLLLCGYLYDGKITLGAFMEANAVFAKVQAGLSTLLHRWVEINELRSVMRRLREFEAALPAAGAGGGEDSGGGGGGGSGRIRGGGAGMRTEASPLMIKP